MPLITFLCHEQFGNHKNSVPTTHVQTWNCDPCVDSKSSLPNGLAFLSKTVTAHPAEQNGGVRKFNNLKNNIKQHCIVKLKCQLDDEIIIVRMFLYGNHQLHSPHVSAQKASP